MENLMTKCIVVNYFCFQNYQAYHTQNSNTLKIFSCQKYKP